jgi:hypothetical protein
MSGFHDRENQLFAILETFNEHDLEFIVIGGYAVSAYEHRFSVDADLVITAELFDRFAGILRDEGYERVADMDLEAGQFVAFERSGDLSVTVDLMVGAVQSRETDAAWQYEELARHAEPVTIEGSERSVTVRIPETEMLMAMKLHSGRLTDARDVVALADNVEFDCVADYLERGDTDQLQTVLERVRDTVESEDFRDAYKGVFTAQDLPADRIEAVQEFLRRQLDELATE